MIFTIVISVIAVVVALSGTGTIAGVTVKSRKAKARKLARKHVDIENQKLLLNAVKELARNVHFENHSSILALDTYKELTQDELDKVMLAMKAGKIKLNEKQVNKASKVKF